MNHRSPMKLNESIRILNSDLNEISITEISGKYYTTKFVIEAFMEENSISDTEGLIESLSIYKDIDHIYVLDETCSDKSLLYTCNANILLEELNPSKTDSAAKGMSALDKYINQFTSFVSGVEYDEEKDIKKYIENCDKVLEEIKEEKERILTGKENSKKKFSMLYITKIALTIFRLFIAPLIITSKFLKIPTAIQALLVPILPENLAGIEKLALGVGSSVAVLTSISADDSIEDLVLSFTDYNRLLTKYEVKIEETKKNLKNKLEVIRRSKGDDKVMELKEDFFAKDAVDVYYQSPEELRINGKTPNVVHDNDQHPVEEPEEKVVGSIEDIEPEQPEKDLPSACYPSCEDNDRDDCCCEPETEKRFTPIDALNKAKCDPINISIAKYGDKYYIDHKDLKCYMDSTGVSNYEAAVKSIINAHDDPDFCAETVRVVLGKNDLADLSEDTKLKLENSTIEFEVY